MTPKETLHQPNDKLKTSYEIINQSRKKHKEDMDYLESCLDAFKNHRDYKLIPMILTFFEYFCPEAESFEKLSALLKTFDFPNLRIQDCELVINGKLLKDWLKENTKSVSNE